MRYATAYRILPSLIFFSFHKFICVSNDICLNVTQSFIFSRFLFAFLSLRAEQTQRFHASKSLSNLSSSIKISVIQFTNSQSFSTENYTTQSSNEGHTKLIALAKELRLANECHIHAKNQILINYNNLKLNK